MMAWAPHSLLLFLVDPWKKTPTTYLKFMTPPLRMRHEEEAMISHRLPITEASTKQSPSPTPIVFVVDDDVSVRESLELLIRCENWQPEIFASAQAFLSRPPDETPSCLLLD